MSHEIKWVWMDARDPAVFNAESHQRALHQRDIFATPSLAMRDGRLAFAERYGRREMPTIAVIPVMVIRQIRSGEEFYNRDHGAWTPRALEAMVGGRLALAELRGHEPIPGIRYSSGDLLVMVWPEGT